MTSTERLRALLDERGIKYETRDALGACETSWCGCTAYQLTPESKLIMHPTPEQAIAATVGAEPWEPSKEWKAWHESLKHDNPTSIREAVENILYEAIEFGGDMGPNGNVWSGVDEGAVLTKGCIDGWVKSIESIAATVGVGTCKLVDNDSGPDMHCTACGGEVDDEYRYFMDSWGYSRCPHCGARIIEEETE